jgi:hypothetical protein
MELKMTQATQVAVAEDDDRDRGEREPYPLALLAVAEAFAGPSEGPQSALQVAGSAHNDTDGATANVKQVMQRLTALARDALSGMDISVPLDMSACDDRGAAGRLFAQSLLTRGSLPGMCCASIRRSCHRVCRQGERERTSGGHCSRRSMSVVSLGVYRQSDPAGTATTLALETFYWPPL